MQAPWAFSFLLAGFVLRCNFPRTHPWNDWFHVMGHTYRTWLPGDPKGFRTRHHREHVEGDYRNPPPPGTYDERHERSKRLMTRDPVFLTWDQRNRAIEESIASLQCRAIQFAIFSIDRIHLHGLARFPDHNPRRWIGLAKLECSHYCKQTGHAPEGRLWATRCKCLPVTGPAHYDNIFDYIRDHVKKGAVIRVAQVPPCPSSTRTHC